jgi:hypothetical protein
MKTPEDEAFDELAKKQGMWGGGFHAKKAMAVDKCQGMNCQKSDVNPEHSLECEAEHAATIAGGYFVKTTQPVQEPDWKDQYEKQKRRAEMWIAKYEKDIGQLERVKPIHAEPAQEPVLWGVKSSNGKFSPYAYWAKKDAERIAASSHVGSVAAPLYTTPPQRPWVGLTDGEILAWVKTAPALDTAEAEWLHVVRAAEQSLKEKNNGA